MPDTPTAPPTPPTPPAPPTPPPVKFAGKYDTPEALEKGIREIRTKTGFEPLPDSLKLIGDGGLYADAAAAEREYKRMESLIGAAKPTKTADLSIETPTPDAEFDVPTLVNKAGLRLDELQAQFSTSGDLTQDQYAAIRKVRPGLTNGDIKAMARGMVAEAALRAQAMEKVVTEAQQIAGGEQQLTLLRAWAAQNITPERLQRLNSQVKADPAFYPDMVRLLTAEHSAAVGAGKAQPLIGGTAANGAVAPPSPAEYKDLERRAMSGDKSAIARIMAMPPAKLL